MTGAARAVKMPKAILGTMRRYNAIFDVIQVEPSPLFFGDFDHSGNDKTDKNGMTYEQSARSS